MIAEIRKLTDQYHSWLSDKTFLREIEDWVEITTPFLDRHNDHMQIYAKPFNNGFILTDHGYTIEDLELSGCKLESPKRRNLLNITLNGFDVKLENKVLQVNATLENFALQKHNLLQAMLAVNDLFYLAAPVVVSLFTEDVAAWLDNSEISYERNVHFRGKSGYNYHYDFVIPKSVNQPNHALFTINNPDGETAKMTVFAWEDTREARRGEYHAYAILNDKERNVPENVTTAFRNYEVRPVRWLARKELLNLLPA